MIYTMIKIQKKSSRYGGHFFYAFFKGDDGNSYYTCLYPKMRNWSRWKKVLKVGAMFTNLKKVKGNPKLIDADSKFSIVGD